MTIGFARYLIPATASVLTLQRERSFRYQMPCSILSTCSRAAVVFTSTNYIPSWSLTLSNSISIIIIRTLNPPRAYKWTILLKDLLSCFAFRLGAWSQVYNIIPLDREIKNSIPFTNITSAIKLTYLWRSYSPGGILVRSGTTLCGFCLVDLPAKRGRSGPIMARVLVISLTVTGQFF